MVDTVLKVARPWLSRLSTGRVKDDSHQALLEEGESVAMRLNLFGLPCVFLALLIIVLPCLPSSAEVQRVYNTPPSALAALSEEELNAFGSRLLTEAYEIRAMVAKPSGGAENMQAEIDSDAVKAVIGLYDEDAMIQRARLNYSLTKKTYVPNHTGDFTIRDVAVSRTSETVLVISFDVRLPDRVSLQSGIVYSRNFAPRILVMRWNAAEGMWKIFSHADFDTPQSYVCGSNKDFMPQKSTFKPEDIEMAKSLWDEVQTSSLTGKPQSMHSPGFQFVFASGERKTKPGKIRARLTKREDITNVEAIRSGDLFVMRFDSISPMTLDGGEIDKKLRPRLATFHHDPDGKWRMAAAAVFQVTAKLADNIQCNE